MNNCLNSWNAKGKFAYYFIFLNFPSRELRFALNSYIENQKHLTRTNAERIFNKNTKEFILTMFFCLYFFYFTEKGLLYIFNIAKYNKKIIITPRNNVKTDEFNIINTSLIFLSFIKFFRKIVKRYSKNITFFFLLRH